MSLLEGIDSPADLRRVPEEDLPALAAEIRAFLVDRVSRTGGHLGPNLGVVELTLALHRVFDSPRDVILWDTGHQSYVHKMVTGRREDFSGLRQEGGLSGYPSRAESPHDVIENSHASTALSYADGIAKGFALSGCLGGDDGRHVVAVVGDGSLTGGMAWEALNNIAASDRPLVVVVNDNERSYSPTIGGVAHHLSTLRTTQGYERFLQWGRRTLQRTPVLGQPVYDALHGMKKGLKDIVAPQGLFEDLGLKYVGPVDGHDVQEVEHALMRARDFGAPVIVHVITEKGRGYAPAETDEADRFHGVGIIDPDTGRPVASGGPSWTGAFADELVALGRGNPRIVAITAAMLGPTGLDRFARAFPERTYDVGIAEQHAAASAAGLAFAGMHPVVAVYATFLNRAFDQVLLDCALHRAGVTFVLDRAGVTGDDGASHNGLWDLSIMGIVPGIRVAAPRDEATLREALCESVSIDDGPSVVRFPKGALPSPVPALEREQGLDILRRDDHAEVLVLSVGAFAPLALEVAARLGDQGIPTAVVDPRWVLPVNPHVGALAQQVRLVVTIEDNSRAGGIGSAVRQALEDQGVTTPVRTFGAPAVFPAQASRARVLQEMGLTAQDVSRQVVEAVAALLPEDQPRVAQEG
ncbi:MAG: 1-deoxy-D-xylulose-5-phosphate synthase [Candidatus Nanopelagicales bacterium]